MKFLDWYLKIAAGSAMIGGSMELFMIKTGFCCLSMACVYVLVFGNYYFLDTGNDDKVTVLESEKRAWESSPEAQAVRDALNPWRDHDNQAEKSS